MRNIIESDDGIIYLSGPRLIGLLEKKISSSKQYSSLFNKIPDSINKNRQSFINTLNLIIKSIFQHQRESLGGMEKNLTKSGNFQIIREVLILKESFILCLK